MPHSRFQPTSVPTPSMGNPLAWAALAVFIATLVSCFSGFVAAPVPFDFKWDLSPLGLLFRFNPELAEIESMPSFQGKLGATFDYLWVFLKTCALEAPFYYIVLRRRGARFATGVLVAANLITHPLIYFAFAYAFRNFLVSVFAAEIYAPLAEAVFVAWIARGPRSNAWAAAAAITLANLFSWQMGAFV